MKERLKVEAGSLAKLENSNDAATAVFGTLQPEAEPASKMVEKAMRESYLIKVCFNELKDLHELATSFALHRSLNLVLADHCKTLPVRGIRPALLTFSFLEITLSTQ